MTGTVGFIRLGTALALSIALTACDSTPDNAADRNTAAVENPVEPAAPRVSEADATLVSGSDGQNFSVARRGGIRRTGTDNQYTLQLPTDVLFDFDKAKLRPEAQPMLREVLADLEGKNVFALQVFGHTDAKGEDAHNMRLSLARAKAVCDFLKSSGKQYTLCLGRGEQEPVEPNANPDGSDNPLGRQLNRRVEIKVSIRPDVEAMMRDAREGR